MAPNSARAIPTPGDRNRPQGSPCGLTTHRSFKAHAGCSTGTALTASPAIRPCLARVSHGEVSIVTSRARAIYTQEIQDGVATLLELIGGAVVGAKNDAIFPGRVPELVRTSFRIFEGLFQPSRTRL
jgi:hypothetical protein